MEKIFNQKGSLLLEILLAVAIGAIIIGAVSGLVYVSLKSGQNSGAKSAAISLAEEGLEAMQSIGEADWHKVYLPPNGEGDPNSSKGTGNPYYICKEGSSWTLCSETVCVVDFAVGCNGGNIQIDDIIYSRKIYIDNVNRNKTGERQICTGVGICTEEKSDPSTQKIKVVISKSGSADIILEEYLTRWKNNISSQSNWSGGRNQENFSDDPSKYYGDDGNIDIGTIGSIKLK